MNYYERHIGDYLKDTAHLSLLEHGVYTRLMDVYYTREGAIPASDAARLIGARSKDEREALAVVLAEFFVLTDGAHAQHRCDREIARFQDKQSKAKRSADARWSAQRSQSEGNADASPNAMRTHSEGNADGMHRAPVPSNQTPDPIPTQAELAPVHPLPSVGGGGSTQSAAPPTPPPDFDGKNADALNGKSVVALGSSWELPEQWGIDAEALGWKPSEVLREAEKFRQYWVAGRGAGTRRSVRGWRQTWSTWLDKAARDRR